MTRVWGWVKYNYKTVKHLLLFLLQFKDYKDYDVSLYGDFSDQTKKEKRNLLGISFISSLLFWTDAKLNKINFFGLSFENVNEQILWIALLIINIYFLYAFCHYAFTDITTWRTVEFQKETKKISQTLKEARDSEQVDKDPKLKAWKRNISSSILKANNRKIIFDVRLPMYFGFISLLFVLIQIVLIIY